MIRAVLFLVFSFFLPCDDSWSSEIKKNDPIEELVSTLKQNPFFSEEFLRYVFESPFLEKRTRLPDSSCAELLLNYNENDLLLGKNSLKKGVEFYEAHKDIFTKTHEAYAVEPQYILAILRLETYFGICTGEYWVLPQLYNLYVNVPRKREFALTEITAFLELSLEYNWIVFDVWGSSMGAIGISQFIPSSMKNFAVDGNEDGIVNMFNPEDAIPSITHFLLVNHWKISKRAGIWNYNHDDRYVRNVFKYAEAIRKEIAP